MNSVLRFGAALILAVSPVFAGEDGWIDLFNGKDLSGWIQHSGKAKYKAENGEIIGTTVLGTGNSFLCTTGTFGDFILELEFKVNPQLNSGIQVRSEVYDSPHRVTVNDKEQTIPADRVFGYQVEIDMDPKNNRWWTAGIYDESRRGWLFPGPLGGGKEAFTRQGAKVSRQHEWNVIKVEAKGASLKTWLNGEPRADLRDEMTLKGLIALQVHGVGNDPSKADLQVRWRNIRLKRL